MKAKTLYHHLWYALLNQVLFVASPRINTVIIPQGDEPEKSNYKDTSR